MGQDVGPAPNDILLTARLSLPKQCRHLETKCSDTGACRGHSTHNGAFVEPEDSSAPHPPSAVSLTSNPGTPNHERPHLKEGGEMAKWLGVFF